MLALEPKGDGPRNVDACKNECEGSREICREEVALCRPASLTGAPPAPALTVVGFGDPGASRYKSINEFLEPLTLFGCSSSERPINGCPCNRSRSFSVNMRFRERLEKADQK
jgi:hypothetical protein